ncbi:MAG: methylated-DNA--[protein]-cysteine S-methyltransferase [Casimicrobiaceae bacterium]|nr:methylated-DNA--[protein]-cysteine S-methyltransferase [Casimicrobiaceae bacterium]MCX8098998.1 methylated-DNA--[protein]-cysteine S-methyltransferase [Casimicrobiaceae bacterium]MDW8311474.1 methylated-DNA--[protein]-cysteine S-methyltransferase [Burkholderiales bacterium]
MILCPTKDEGVLRVRPATRWGVGRDLVTPSRIAKVPAACFCLRFSSPIGTLLAIECAGAITDLHLVTARRVPRVPPGAREVRTALLRSLERQLAEYFAGTRRRFDVPLAPRGTAFQQEVWAALCAIPYGQRRSYAELAHALGRATAARAVAAANARNPILILIPCHRVIAARGELGGYSGGVPVKRFLLALEAAQRG